MHKLWGMLFVAVVMLSATRAEARSFGPVSFETPEGWNEAGKTDPGGDLLELYPYQGSGKIAVHTGQRGGDAEKMARKQLPKRASIVNEGEFAVAGQAGYYLAATAGGKVWVVAATVAGGGGVVFALTTTEDEFDAANAAFATMVDGARIGGEADAAPAPPPRDTGYYGDAGDAPTQHAVVLRTVGSGCTATMTFDGQTYQLAEGEERRLEVSAGPHTFTWTNNDGTTGETTAEVPQFDRFTGGCQPPRRGGGQSPRRPEPEADAPSPRRPEPDVAPAPRGTRYSEEQLVLGAKYHLYLTYSGINIVVGSNIQVTDAQMNEWLGSAVPAARTDGAWADVLVQLIDGYPAFLAEWNGAVERGDEELQYQNMRAAARMLNGMNPSEFPLQRCDDGDEIDCLIAAKRRWFQAQQQSQRDAARVQDAAYWQAQFNMEAMRHATNMMIISNM